MPEDCFGDCFLLTSEYVKSEEAKTLMLNDQLVFLGMSGDSVGRQAHTIPIPVSTVDQISSRVREYLAMLPGEYTNVMRNIPATQDLLSRTVSCSLQVQFMTYPAPSRKIPLIMTFLFDGSWSRRTM